MYEIRQKKMQELKQKKWYPYALLATAIFLFSQGSSIIRSSIGYTLPVILISLILHGKSVGTLSEKLFKIKYSPAANAAMIIFLAAIAAFCYFNKLGVLLIIILDILTIAVYVAIAYICSKLKTGDM
ncbi:MULTISPECIES: hypothetical protein [unclassified Sedimentibacter]|uniref:hypothetical protein n=1 Tax=unclassified Sedimentibacter TaxID=2649220 RepID=UPI0027E14296|nr:hypothetical protein [Sedimentibacter sp. MB35-C1]WMJ77570.1 hypothetical protein RBQ61_01175 [Sedimentibacter sp. MB35-C1]